jgi:hypothetical protein
MYLAEQDQLGSSLGKVLIFIFISLHTDRPSSWAVSAAAKILPDDGDKNEWKPFLRDDGCLARTR